MVQLIATCPDHGPFPSGVELGEGSHAMAIVGGKSACPVCRRPSPIQSGTFSVIGGVLRLTKQLTQEELRRLHRIALSAASGETAHEKARAEASAVSRQSAALFGSLSADQWTLVVAILTLLLTAYGVFAPNPVLQDISAKLSRQNVTAEQISELLEEQHQTDEQILAEARRAADAAEATEAQPSKQEAQPRVAAPPGRLSKRQSRRLRGKTKSSR